MNAALFYDDKLKSGKVYRDEFRLGKYKYLN